ncbi:acyltransferase 3 [Ilyonectria robusta]|uniref:acyltransferase 3 n=1 Tax=Ilyonectria robusta TaxID=1079257 RepID=UPI001E8EB1C5|nr:acyltransferase 3 [Ilyonectria robusta]KAH8734204.1 acyltransferase 3 [Ilyonectria robusta]
MRARNREGSMLSSFWADSALAHGRQSDEEQLRHGDRGDRGGVDDKGSASASASASASRSRDKVRCLDGLRGIACLIVFNYHFLWPWTPSIMLGYGALPPRAPEPYEAWSSLPIICLLNRGRPMVAIFFAISGYVLCRHILRAIHERRLDTAYQKLASSVFRRVFRLYIPPTISMFLVAMLAQLGVFRSEMAIYKGPDSIYINGTVTIAQLGGPCYNGSFPVNSAAAVADSLGLRSSAYLNTTGWTDILCLNSSSELLGPSALYQVEDEYEALFANDTAASNSTKTRKKKKVTPHAYLKDNRERNAHELPYEFLAVGAGNHSNITNTTDPVWVQFGGSWEEHPFIHDNITYALQNFTRAYAEWANPFNFGHYHPRYDPHTFTIPMELRGSMVIYLFLLGTAALKVKWRLRFVALFSAYSLTLGRWDMATFLGGTMLSEIDILSDPVQGLPPVAGATKGRQALFKKPAFGARAKRWGVIILALYFLSYPDAGAEYTPGFVVLSYFVPKYYIPLSGWMFYQAIGALLLLPCVLRSPFLRGILEGPVAQYLGKISFSLYLVHGPILHSLGFWIMPRLFERVGQAGGFVIGYVVLLSITLYLADWWYRKIDVWSMTVGRRVESMLVV